VTAQKGKTGGRDMEGDWSLSLTSNKSRRPQKAARIETDDIEHVLEFTRRIENEQKIEGPDTGEIIKRL
jgi:hypothetical protein